MFAELLLKHMSAEAEADAKPSILPEAAIMRMREFGARYAEHLNGPRFAVGQIVTPVSGGDMPGAGHPLLVIETRRAGPDFAAGDAASNFFGCRWDTRVLRIEGGEKVVPYWVESWCLELWNPPQADAPASAA